MSGQEGVSGIIQGTWNLESFHTILSPLLYIWREDGIFYRNMGVRTYCIIVFCLFSRQVLSSSRILQQVAMSGAFPSGMGQWCTHSPCCWQVSIRFGTRYFESSPLVQSTKISWIPQFFSSPANRLTLANKQKPIELKDKEISTLVLSLLFNLQG